MKTIKFIIVIFFATSIYTSCSTDEIVSESNNIGITATGDKGDDISNPDVECYNFIVVDSAVIKTTRTGDKGDDIGKPGD